jgi:hypothetical protein
VSFRHVVVAERFGAVSPGCAVPAGALLFEVIMVSAALPRQEGPVGLFGDMPAWVLVAVGEF